MITYKKINQIQPKWKDQDWILSKAKAAYQEEVPHITDIHAKASEGGIHDYYSNGDYWWANPDTETGLPYIQRDGQTNPDNFNEHRRLLRHMRTNSVFLAAAYHLTGEVSYAAQGVKILKEFFLYKETRMNPSLNYAQALPGICSGRGIGIIDTLHLVDVVFAIEEIKKSGQMDDPTYEGLKDWFASYLGWMLTDRKGIEEMNTDNNHAVCFFVQVAAFSLFTDNVQLVRFCREHYKGVLLRQMAEDGSFPRELKRTKPYNYSLFVLDNMVSLCQLLSSPKDDLWEYELPGGRGIKKGIAYILPYVMDKTSWPYPPDVMHDEAFPARASFLLFAGYHLGIEELIRRYDSLPVEIEDEEARRNIAVRLPMLWM